MDIIAHALWTSAAAIIAGRKQERRISWGWAAAWGVLPDIAAFSVPAAVRIWRFLTGASNSLLPDGRGPHFDWVWGLYNCTHSALVFTLCFAMVWLVLRRPVLEMLGWALHMVIDIFTHTGRFAVEFLWPVSWVRFEGIRWESPWVLTATYAALASVYLLIWTRRTSRRAIASERAGQEGEHD